MSFILASPKTQGEEYVFGKENCEFHFGNGYEVLVRMSECRWPLAVGAG